MLIVFIVLAGLWIMGGTIFVVREIEVVDFNPEMAVAPQLKTEIVNRVGLKGKNILFSIKEEKIKASIKAVDPMLKVQSIKTKFPNKVVINISKRIPIYTDGDHFFDADMCVVQGTSAAGYVDITGANIQLTNPTMGNAAVGATARDHRKIAQLQVVGGYFDSITGWQIAFDDSEVEVGADRLCLILQLGPNVKFQIKTKPHDDFAKILAYTHAVYKEQGHLGEYTAWYSNSNGKIVVDVIDNEGENHLYGE